MLNNKVIDDEYIVCLLGWYFGKCLSDVRNTNWTQEDVDKAQRYCMEKCVDPMEYFGM